MNAEQIGQITLRRRRTLMSMPRSTVNGLTLLQMGARHASYGVKKMHCAAVGAALFWALEHGLDYYFTPDARRAWAAALELLASVMQAGAAETIT